MASFKKPGNLFEDSSHVCLFMYTGLMESMYS